MSDSSATTPLDKPSTVSPDKNSQPGTTSQLGTTPKKPKSAPNHWDDELMTTRQLMEFLGLSRTKIWELVNKQQLPAFKIGGDYRYRRSEVIKWLERFRVDRS